MPKQKLNLLALDGHAAHDVSTLHVLKRLMEILDPINPPKPCIYFDLIGGTGSGSIMAIMLGRLQMTVDDCIDAYNSVFDRVVSNQKYRATIADIVQESFGPHELGQAMKEIVRRQGLKEDASLKDPTGQRCKVLVCAASKTSDCHETLRLTSYGPSYGRASSSYEIEIWRAALATSAGSAFLRPPTAQQSHEKPVDNTDETENPTYEVWSEAHRIWPNIPLETKVGCFLSIGTGIPSLGTFTNDLVSIGLNLPKITSEQVKGSERIRSNETGNYYRFNAIASLEKIQMDQSGVTSHIAIATDRYIDSYIAFTQLKTCGERLTGRSGVNNYQVPFSLDGVPISSTFVGRTTEMEQLERRLLPNEQNPVRKSAVLTGLTGTGKTCLSVEFARRHQLRFDSIMWINGSSRIKLEQSIAAFACRIPTWQLPQAKRITSRYSMSETKTLMEDVLRWFSVPENNRWLIIYDNVGDTLQPAEAPHIRRSSRFHFYIPEGNHGSIIITTRRTDLASIGIPLAIDQLNYEQALALFKVRCESSFSETQESRKLLYLLGGNSLAIVYASAFIQQTKTALAEYIALYTEHLKKCLDDKWCFSNNARSICITWRISCHALWRTNMAGIFLLHVWSYLSNDSLWFELLVPAYERLSRESYMPDWFRTIAGSSVEYTRNINVLLDYCLIEMKSSSSCFVTSSLGHDLASQMLSEQVVEEQTWLAAVVIGMAAQNEASLMLEDGAQAPKGSIFMQQRLFSHAISYACHETNGRDRCAQFLNDSKRRALLAESHFRIADLISDFEDGSITTTRLYEKAASGYQNAFGEEHLLTMEARAKVGMATAQPLLVEKWIQRALQEDQKISGLDQISILDTVCTLAKYMALNPKRLVDAEKLLQLAQREHEKAHGIEHLSTIKAYEDLAQLYEKDSRLGNKKDRLLQAKEMYLRALQGYEKRLGGTEISESQTLDSLGSIYYEVGDLQKASEMLQRASDGYNKTIPADHPLALTNLSNLGKVYKKQAKLDQAEKLYQQLAQAYERNKGTKHEDILSTYISLGFVHVSQGKKDLARKSYQRVLHECEKNYGSGEMFGWPLDIAENLVLLSSKQGEQCKPGETEALFQRLIRTVEYSFGAGHKHTSDVIKRFANFYCKHGKLVEAEKLYQCSLQKIDETLGTQDSSVRSIAEELYPIFFKQGKFSEAEAMCQRALPASEEAHEVKHSSDMRIVKNLGTIYWRQGKFEEAERIYELAMEMSEQTYGIEHKSTLSIISDLGRLCEEDDKLDKAQKWYQQALQGYEKTLGKQHKMTISMIIKLQHVCEKQSRQSDTIYQSSVISASESYPIHLSKTTDLKTIREKQGLQGEVTRLPQAVSVLESSCNKTSKAVTLDYKYSGQDKTIQQPVAVGAPKLSPIKVSKTAESNNISEKRNKQGDAIYQSAAIGARDTPSSKTLKTTLMSYKQGRQHEAMLAPRNTSIYDRSFRIHQKQAAEAIAQQTIAHKYRERFLKTGNVADSQAAIRLTRDAVNIVPETYHCRLSWLTENLSQLRDSYAKTKAVADLGDIIEIIRKIVQVKSEEMSDRAYWLFELGRALSDKYSRSAAMADLEEAIKVTQEALYSVPEDHGNWKSLLHDLGGLLDSKFTRTGVLADLDEAIRTLCKVVDATPTDDKFRMRRLIDLGSSLHRRFLRTAALSDLEESIRLGQEAIALGPRRYSCGPQALGNLGLWFLSRFRRTEALSDLQESNRLMQEALDISPKSHQLHSDWLGRLGVGYYTSFKTTGLIAHLNEALRLEQQAIKTMRENHPNRTALLHQHGDHVYEKYLKTRATSDLEEAIQLAQEAIDATPDNHLERSDRFLSLGRFYKQRFSETGIPADLKSSFLYFQFALYQSHSPIPLRIEAGRSAVSCCVTNGDVQQAYKTAAYAVGLVPKLLERSLTNSDKQHLLKEVVGLASDAAAVALDANARPDAALALLEQGRGVLAASLEDMRADITEMQRKYPTRALQYTRLRDALETTLISDTFPTEEEQAYSNPTPIDRRYEAYREFDNYVKEIRDYFILGDFLAAPKTQDMQNAASRGPVVVINVSKYRCDAILVEKDQIRSLPLSDLNMGEINKRANGADVKGMKVLEWLWDIVAKPVLNALGFSEHPDDQVLPHIWWIPTGSLSKFPIHAAGRHTDGSSDTVMDRVMSSYSSSVKAIIQGRRRQAKEPSSLDQALLVAMKNTPGQASLHFAEEEVAKLSELYKSISIAPVEPGRRKNDVLSNLANCKIFHFAGHGHTDLADPSQSYLLLEDWREDRLTVSTLPDMNLRSQSPFLAYLSACGTGQIKNEAFVDESIHLISAYQLAGFRHVIGTLWEVNDQICVDMAEITYQEIGSSNMTDESVCLGLHKAGRKIRDIWLRTQVNNEYRRSLLRNRGNKVAYQTPCDTQATNRDTAGDVPHRDIVLDDDDDEDEVLAGPLHWVPYVHFGV